MLYSNRFDIRLEGELIKCKNQKQYLSMKMQYGCKIILFHIEKSSTKKLKHPCRQARNDVNVVKVIAAPERIALK
jgi:pentose-5-phosphate-3-epimerase